MQKKPDKMQSDVAAKVWAEALKEREAWIKENGVPLADIQVSKVGYFDPDERAREKARSREQDDEDLKSGKITREELQRINGGHGIFRNSKISHRPRFRGSIKPEAPKDK